MWGIVPTVGSIFAVLRAHLAGGSSDLIDPGWLALAANAFLLVVGALI